MENHQSNPSEPIICSCKNLETKYFNEKDKIKTKLLPEILSLCVLNALIPNSGMLEWEHLPDFVIQKLDQLFNLKQYT